MTHVVTLPDGSVHNFPDEATPEMIAGALNVAPPDYSFSDRVGRDYQGRVKNAQNVADEYAKGNTSGPAAGLEGAAQLGLGPVNDIIKEGISSGISGLRVISSERANNNFDNEVSTVKNSAVGQAVGKAAGYVSDQYSKLPQSWQNAGNAIGTTIEGAANLSGLGEVSDALKPIGNVLIKSGQASAEANKLSFAQKLVAPLNTSKADKLGAVKNTDVVGRMKKSVVQPSAQETESASHVAQIPEVSPKNTMQGNYNAISDAISTEAEGLKARLEKSPVNYMQVKDPQFPTPQNVFHPVLDQAIEGLSKNTTLVGDAKTVAVNLANKMKELVDANPPTPAGLLEARKKFDQYVKAGKPKIFDQNVENGISAANDVVRKTTNDFIAQTVPDAEVKASLAKQSSLYRAMENVAPKAAAERPTALGRMGQKIDAAMPVKNTLVKGAGATLGASGLLAGGIVAPAATAAIAGTAGAGYGLVKLATSPKTRMLLGKAMGGAEVSENPLSNLSKNSLKK